MSIRTHLDNIGPEESKALATINAIFKVEVGQSSIGERIAILKADAHQIFPSEPGSSDLLNESASILRQFKSSGYRVAIEVERANHELALGLLVGFWRLGVRDCTLSLPGISPNNRNSLEMILKSEVGETIKLLKAGETIDFHSTQGDSERQNRNVLLRLLASRMVQEAKNSSV